MAIRSAVDSKEVPVLVGEREFFFRGHKLFNVDYIEEDNCQRDLNVQETQTFESQTEAKQCNVGSATMEKKREVEKERE